MKIEDLKYGDLIIPAKGHYKDDPHYFLAHRENSGVYCAGGGMSDIGFFINGAGNHPTTRKTFEAGEWYPFPKQDINPCICKGKPNIETEKENGKISYFIKCPLCKVTSKKWYIETKAIENWNSITPFTFEDREILLGAKIKNKNGIAVNIITGCHLDGVTINGRTVSYEALLIKWTFLDEKICGKIKNA